MVLLCYRYGTWETKKWRDLDKVIVPWLKMARPGVNSLCCLFSHSVVSNFATPWTAARQASLSFTISQNLLKLKSIESVILSYHLILCLSPSPSAFNLSQHQGLFQWVSSSHQVAQVFELQLQDQSFQWIFRTDLQDGLVGSPCSPRDSQQSSPNHSSKASILRRSAFFMVQLSHPYMTTHSFNYMDLCQQSDVSPF